MHTGAWSDPHGGTPDERGSRDVARAGISPYLPRALDHVSGIPELRESWRDLLEERRTAARRVSRLLSYRARIRHESAAAGLPLVLRAEAEKAAVRNIAVTLGMAERTVTMLLNAAEYARENLPATWSAFLHGALDMPRVQKIATTASGMLSEKNRRVLDESAAHYAAQVNAGTLQSWLNRAAAALDAEEYAARCQKAREDRFVCQRRSKSGHLSTFEN